MKVTEECILRPWKTFKSSFVRDHNIHSNLESSIRKNPNFYILAKCIDFANSTTCINLSAKNGLKRIVRNSISCCYLLCQLKNNNFAQQLYTFETFYSYELNGQYQQHGIKQEFLPHINAHWLLSITNNQNISTVIFNGHICCTFRRTLMSKTAYFLAKYLSGQVWAWPESQC